MCPPRAPSIPTDNLSARGAYELVGDANAKVTFLSTGSEISIALAARDLLAKEGIGARIVSMPCWDLFEEQDEALRKKLLGESAARRDRGRRTALAGTAISAPNGAFVGMHSFGASGPWKGRVQAFQHHAGSGREVADRQEKRSMSERWPADRRWNGFACCHQRLWPHRAAGAAGDCGIGPPRYRNRGGQ